MYEWCPKGRVDMYLDYLNEHRDNIPAAKGRRFRAEDYIGSAWSSRLYMHQCNAVKARALDPALIDKEFYYDIRQHVTWARSPTGSLPRPLTESTVWSERAARPLLPEEILAAQGAPSRNNSMSVVFKLCVRVLVRFVLVFVFVSCKNKGLPANQTVADYETRAPWLQTWSFLSHRQMGCLAGNGQSLPLFGSLLALCLFTVDRSDEAVEDVKVPEDNACNAAD